ncbi:hypothetical protein ACKFKG_26235 [Phormidesmis sp. 146-35]
MTLLRYLTVDLFLYDLHDTLTASDDKMKEVHQKFWWRIYGDEAPAKQIVLSEIENSFPSYVKLLNDRTDCIEKFPDSEDGYYYPVKIGDTYAVQIDYSGKPNDPDWENPNIAERLQLLKQTVLLKTRNVAPNLGQNWLISAQLTDSEEAKSVAEKCYQSWSSHANWEQDYKGSGTFKGASFFELVRQDTTADGNNHNEYLLICLFPETYKKDEMNRMVAQLYRDLIELFLSRNKVLWLYEQSRLFKPTLKRMNHEVQQMQSELKHQIISASINLHHLQKTLAEVLSISNDYESFLSILQTQMTAIESNIRFYKKRVESLRNRDTQADLEFLYRFSTYATENYLTQIKADSTAFNAGLKPIGTFIKTIQGITEIEKAKNDRRFNSTVQIATVGVSTASLAASTLSNQADTIVKTVFPVAKDQPIPLHNAWLNFLVPFLLSAAIGALCARIWAWYIHRNWHH